MKKGGLEQSGPLEGTSGACEKCGFQWFLDTLKEDTDTCRECESDALNKQLSALEEDVHGVRDLIRDFLGGPSEMPAGLKHAAEALIIRCQDAEKRGSGQRTGSEPEAVPDEGNPQNRSR